MAAAAATTAVMRSPRRRVHCIRWTAFPPSGVTSCEILPDAGATTVLHHERARERWRGEAGGEARPLGGPGEPRRDGLAGPAREAQRHEHGLFQRAARGDG